MEVEVLKRSAGVLLLAIVVAIALAMLFSRAYPEVGMTPGLYLLFALLGLIIAIVGDSTARFLISSKHRPTEQPEEKK